MKFFKRLNKLENWCRNNKLNIDIMKDDTYIYQIYTNIDDVLYIEQIKYNRSINFYCVYDRYNILKGSTKGNTQAELIKIIDSIINNKTSAEEKEENKNTDKNIDSFIKEVTTVINKDLSNSIFDLYYDGSNYNEIVNNLNQYVNSDTLNKTIKESKNYVDFYCNKYNMSNDLKLLNNKIFINDIEIKINI